MGVENGIHFFAFAAFFRDEADLDARHVLLGFLLAWPREYYPTVDGVIRVLRGEWGMLSGKTKPLRT